MKTTIHLLKFIQFKLSIEQLTAFLIDKFTMKNFFAHRTIASNIFNED